MDFTYNQKKLFKNLYGEILSPVNELPFNEIERNNIKIFFFKIIINSFTCTKSSFLTLYKKIQIKYFYCTLGCVLYFNEENVHIVENVLFCIQLINELPVDKHIICINKQVLYNTKLTNHHYINTPGLFFSYIHILHKFTLMYKDYCKFYT